MMNTKLKSALVAILILGAGSVAMADFNFGVRTDDFYFSVGKYDYYPYGVPQGYRPRISFYDVMSDYGSWVYFQPFGRVWRPYADYRWRPYVYGHWIYTQYGPTWQGYEPWAWVGYHYGDWIWTQDFGWVWIPGYDWHAGRVAWSYGAEQIGWMPAPPAGYYYDQGNLRNYGTGYYNTPYRYGGYYDPASYTGVNVNLWVFINTDHYRADNYADYCLDRYRTRDLFARRAVRISSQPFQRTQLERIVKQRVDEVPVEVRELETERKAVRVILPKGEDEHIRKNAGRVVKDVIRPAFEKQNRKFEGQNTHNEKAVERIFKQKPATHETPARNTNNNEPNRNRNTQFEDNRKQGSNSRFQEPDKRTSIGSSRDVEFDRNRNAEKETPKPVFRNGNQEEDRERNPATAKSFQFDPQSRSNGSGREQPVAPRERGKDVQFDRPAAQERADTLEPARQDRSNDEKAALDQSESDNHRKQTAKEKDSSHDRKPEKGKKKAADKASGSPSLH